MTDLHTIVQRMIDSPDVVTHSKRSGTAHLASAMPNMLTLCGIEYDSFVSDLGKIKACRTCAKIHLARRSLNIHEGHRRD